MKTLSTATTISKTTDFCDIFRAADELSVKTAHNWNKRQSAFRFEDDSILIIDGKNEKIMKKYNSNLPKWIIWS